MKLRLIVRNRGTRGDGTGDRRRETEVCQTFDLCPPPPDSRPSDSRSLTPVPCLLAVKTPSSFGSSA